MKFKFSLDPVLKVREQQEKIQKQELAETLVRQKEVSSRRAEMKHRLETLLQTLQNRDFASIHSLKRHRHQIQQLHREIEALNREWQKARKAVKRERTKLAVAFQKRHMIENLKDNEQKEFLEKLSRHEQKVMDEIATQKFSS